ncbi:MAG: zinc-binding dehydrogenase [Pyrinomonadaceae bacterium]
MLSLHELVGVVAQSRSSSFKEGDRVLALPLIHQRGLAEYFLSTPNLAIALPRGRVDHLVVSQPLGTVIHACLKLPNLLGQTAVIIGQGPIGLLFTASLRRMGVTRLIAVDLLPERLKISWQMGATETICGSEEEVREAVNAYTNGEGVDLAIEAVGVAETLNLAASLIRRNGTLLAFGVPHSHMCDFAFHNFFHKEGGLSQASALTCKRFPAGS